MDISFSSGWIESVSREGSIPSRYGAWSPRCQIWMESLMGWGLGACSCLPPFAGGTKLQQRRGIEGGRSDGRVRLEARAVPACTWAGLGWAPAYLGRYLPRLVVSIQVPVPNPPNTPNLSHHHQVCSSASPNDEARLQRSRQQNRVRRPQLKVTSWS